MGLWTPWSPRPLHRALSPTPGCPALCPLRFWISWGMQTTQPLWTTSSSFGLVYYYDKMKFYCFSISISCHWYCQWAPLRRNWLLLPRSRQIFINIGKNCKPSSARWTVLRVSAPPEWKVVQSHKHLCGPALDCLQNEHDSSAREPKTGHTQ